MLRYFKFAPLLAVCMLAPACTPSSKTEAESAKRKPVPADDFTGIQGDWAITSLRGHTEVHNTPVKVEQSGDALDHEVLDLKISIDAKGTGQIEGQSRCRDLLTRINPLTNLLTRPIVSETGIMKGASLVALTIDANKCQSLPEEQPYVRSLQKVTVAKMADGELLTAFPSNGGLFKAGWSSFRAESECKKLTNRKYLTLLNREGIGHTLACIGHIGGDKATLRLLLLPYAQQYVIQADFARTAPAAE